MLPGKLIPLLPQMIQSVENSIMLLPGVTIESKATCYSSIVTALPLLSDDETVLVGLPLCLIPHLLLPNGTLTLPLLVLSARHVCFSSSLFFHHRHT